MIKMRKAALLVGTISIWAMLIFTVDGITWDLTSEKTDSYTKMLTDLRKKVQGTTCFKIPVINKTPQKLYLEVDVKVSATQTIRVALKATDLYVVGYADNKDAFVLKPKDKEGPFPNAKELPYTGSYQDLEKSINAGDRRKLDQTPKAIQKLAKEIYGKNIDNKDLKQKQAQFLLTAIQMIAEAARFKYIEEQVKRHYGVYNFKMDDKMYTIVTKWDTISTAIANAKSNGAFITTLDLVGPDGKKYEASKVKDVEDDMGILNYVKQKCAKTLSLQYVTSEWPLALAHMLAQA